MADANGERDQPHQQVEDEPEAAAAPPEVVISESPIQPPAEPDTRHQGAIKKRPSPNLKLPKESSRRSRRSPSLSPEIAAVHDPESFKTPPNLRPSPNLRLPEDSRIKDADRRLSRRSPLVIPPRLDFYEPEVQPKSILKRPKDAPGSPARVHVALQDEARCLDISHPEVGPQEPSVGKTGYPITIYRQPLEAGPTSPQPQKPQSLGYLSEAQIEQALEKLGRRNLFADLPEEDGLHPIQEELSASQQFRLNRLLASRRFCTMIVLLVAGLIVGGTIAVSSVFSPIIEANSMNGTEEAPEDKANAPNYDIPALTVNAHLAQFVVDTRNPCDNLYSHACGRFHKFFPDSKPSIIKGALSLFASTIRKWVVEPMEHMSFGYSFTAMKRFYHTCLNTPDPDRDNKFKALLVEVSFRTLPDKFAWHHLAKSAVDIGLYPHIFLNVSVILEASHNRTSILVGPSMDPVSPMHDKLWNGEGLARVVRLIKLEDHSFKINLRLTTRFALGLHQVVLDTAQSNRTSLFNGSHWLNLPVLRSNIDFRRVMKDLTGVRRMPPVLTSSRLEAFLVGLEELEARFGIEASVNYFRVMAAAADCGYLSDAMREACALFQDMPPREQFCYDVVTNSPWFEGVAYVEYFHKFATAYNWGRLLVQFHMITDGLKATLETDQWLNSIAKYGALQQLDNSSIQLGWVKEVADMENSNYNLYLQKSPVFPTVVGAVAAFRPQYHKERFLSCRFNDQHLLRSFEVKPQMSWDNFAYYSPEKNRITIHPVAFQILIEDPNPPMVYEVATLGVWVSTALIRTLEFPDIQPKQCTYPADFWKYNLRLYQRNYIHCAEDQYKEYIAQFHIGQSDHENLSDYKVLSRFAGTNVAFHTYRVWLKERGTSDPATIGLHYTPLQAFWVIATTYQCDRGALHGSITDGAYVVGKASGKKHIPPVLKPRFSVNGFGYGSQSFATAFGCSPTARMHAHSYCPFFT